MARPVTKDIPLSRCVRQLISDAKMDDAEGIEDIAEALGKSVAVFRNKLSSGNFTVEELLTIVYITGGTMSIRTKSMDFTFLPEKFCSEETMERIRKFEEKDKNKRIRKLGEALGIDDPEILEQMYEDMMEVSKTGKPKLKKMPVKQ